MNDNIAVEFENVGKQYRLGRIGTGTLAHDMNRWIQTTLLRREDPYLKLGEINDRTTKGSSEYVWALRDISFKIEKGDVVGIIGSNGAGKSTLLKLLSHITAPSTGQIGINGRIASLLEVGTGFHPEMTARENIYMNGSILGMKRYEINDRFDDIVDFSGVERYLDTPVKRFSSGMIVRLGFAVAAFLDPEILVVDEVLAVGDADFQKKSLGKMHEISSGGGRTVLFVSHNMASVKNLCKSGIVLKNGMMDYAGTAEDCVGRYLGNSVSNVTNHAVFVNQDHFAYLDRWLEFLELTMLGDVTAMATDDPIEIVARIRRNNSLVTETQITFLALNMEDEPVVLYVSKPFKVPQDRNVFDVRMKMTGHSLARGTYKIKIEIGRKDFVSNIINHDIIGNAMSFEVKYVSRSDMREYISWHRDWAGSISHFQRDMELTVEP